MVDHRLVITLRKHENTIIEKFRGEANHTCQRYISITKTIRTYSFNPNKPFTRLPIFFFFLYPQISIQ